jgi:cytochrome P450
MTWTLYNLVNNSNVYHQCQAEIDSVLNDNDLTASTISLLTYTESVLKESLRYQTPVPLMLRTAIEDNTIIASNGKHIHIRKGTDVVVNLQMLHR